MLPTPLLLLLLYDLLQLRRQWRNPFPHNLHFAAWSAAHDDIEFAKILILVGIVVTEVSAAAFPALKAGPRDCFLNC